MHPSPSCNGRTRNAEYEYMSMYFTFATLPTSPLQYCLSVGNKQSLCPLMWGAQEKSEGHIKTLRRHCAPPPTCKLLPTPLTMSRPKTKRQYNDSRLTAITSSSLLFSDLMLRHPKFIRQSVVGYVTLWCCR